MRLISELKELGFVYQCSQEDELNSLLENGKIVFYLGLDCTAKSLHIGNLMPIMLLRKLQKYGNKPIIVIGGGTTKIGDPSGKDQTRKEILQEIIDVNIEGIKKSLSKFLITDTKETNSVIIVDNDSWLSQLGYIEFLKKYGRYFSVNKMLTMESVKSRLNKQSHLSFLEFNYILLQAYDFYQLHKKFKCNLQIGGSDQWGNIIFGVDLIHALTAENTYAMTTHLITKSDGSKMGKSAQGAIWLNEDMLSPYQYYQFWKNIDDLDVVKFAKIYCDFNKLQLEQFIKTSTQNIIQAKTELAYRVTKLAHGKIQAEKAYQASKKIFEQNDLDEEALPKIYIERAAALDKPIYHLLKISGLTISYTQAKKAILNRSIKMNNSLINDVNHVLCSKDFNSKNFIKISFGKKKHFVIYIT